MGVGVVGGVGTVALRLPGVILTARSRSLRATLYWFICARARRRRPRWRRACRACAEADFTHSRLARPDRGFCASRVDARQDPRFQNVAGSRRFRPPRARKMLTGIAVSRARAAGPARQTSAGQRASNWSKGGAAGGRRIRAADERRHHAGITQAGMRPR